MKESYYYHKDTIILNYSKKYITNKHEVVETEAFDCFLDHYLSYLQKHHMDLYAYLGKANHSLIKAHIKSTLKQLLICEVDEIQDEYVHRPKLLLDLIEEGYHFWRSLERYSILYTHHEEGFQIQNFIEADEKESKLVLNFYREIQQKVQGTKNKVYRQLHAGTNASMLLSYYPWQNIKGYEALQGIPFISQILLRTPLILHPKHNKRTNVFTETFVNPMKDFIKGDEEWLCYPAKIGTILVYAYFHRDFIGSAVACANLFELANAQETMTKKPDAILLFGNPDGKKDTTFYHDQENDIWVGKCSNDLVIDYFGYTKKSMLTLHNLVMITRGSLPIHGAMVNLYLKDGTKKGLMIMGDSGAGKSETLEALNTMASDLIDYQEIVFDDMGTIHIGEDGHPYGQGTEIGAFVRLDDLDKGTAYKDMERSIFFNPEKANARVVIPASSYEVIVQDHPIDVFLYANNYSDERGMRLFKTREEAEPVFIEGKRFALGTTQEKGLSTTFFANPFGPMQRQTETRRLIDKMFDKLFEENIPVGEIYTCLGLENKGDHGIDEAAKALVAFVQATVLRNS
ncbi:hypothetical protein [Bulleidia sp. zg-1006]|uniref:hypothetical protein n=1 Tax=Bulleidia sp. zg-1006 TaxID=2806552 RepID=UPI00193A3AF1|nr:hypothetical protein [Bulleidia sp. zg-1006]QRG87382.1 hypothetical protein JOS54_03480 [Bulleidia sp. zg-1006]